MRTHKLFIIVEMNTNRIIHQTTDKYESMKEFDKLRKQKKSVTALCVYS